MADNLIERLRAYIAQREKIRDGGNTITECNGVPLTVTDLHEAADALEAAREDAERWNELCRQIDAGEFHPSILDDAMNMGAGALEMHVDDTIDAAREARNG